MRARCSTNSATRLHGLLSDVTYPLLAGTSVSTDFVELPSQLYEHWLSQPEILRRFATHYRTGEPMPEALLERLMAARNFNQGFATVEYLASAFVDLDLHRRKDRATSTCRRSRRRRSQTIGMPREIVMRHRTPHFTHVFSGDGYSSGYYSYLWSEVLDADAFTAFEETGDVFDQDMADKLKALHLLGRQPARPGRSLYGVPRTAAHGRRASWRSADWWRWWKTLEVNWRA